MLIILKIKDTVCEIYKEYKVKDKLLSEIGKNFSNNLFVLQVEFILIINPVNSDFKKCFINLVVQEDEVNDKIGDNYIFKNSVTFTNNENEPYIPYTYSGNIGYLNGYPLKIYIENEKKVFNDFYIIGRDKNGNCRQGNDLLSYLYFSDKPLLFNEDYTYSCILSSTTTTSLTETVLYKKIIGITRIAKYGSSDYKNVDSEDWIIVNTDNVKSITHEDNKNYIITMNIKFKTDQKKGFYSHKYIDDVSFKVDKPDKPDCNGDCLVKLEIKFSGDDETNDTRYKKIPDIPFFIPNIPDDILDPLINPDVDK